MKPCNGLNSEWVKVVVSFKEVLTQILSLGGKRKGDNKLEVIFLFELFSYLVFIYRNQVSREFIIRIMG